jgi:DNA-binding NarL/FixJ family response regulator
MRTTRILIADDHDVVRKGIRTILASHPGLEVCGEAVDGRQALEMAHSLRPDIVVIDIGMPVLNGLEATRQILKTRPESKVLVLTMHESDQVVLQVLEAGARGYLLKSDTVTDLIKAVNELQNNKTFFTYSVGQLVLDNYLHPNQVTECSLRNPLTSREREILQLLAEGKSAKEVAVSLNLSVKTAETHRSNLMRKLKVHSVSELVLYAVRNNIVQALALPSDLKPGIPSPVDCS